MKPVHLVLAMTFALLAFSAVVWVGRYQVQHSTAKSLPEPEELSELPIPEHGPYGKAVASEESYDFGVLEKGKKGSHVFVIKNEGPGPLRVKKGKTSCGQCTFGEVSRTDDIPPGETVEVTVNWELKSDAPMFRQTADVYTTDPEHKKLQFAIEGKVDIPVRVSPEGTWGMGDLNESEPTVVEGLIYSTMIDAFEIESAECANPLVSVTWRPATSEEAAKYKPSTSSPNPTVAYKVSVTVAKGTTIGPLRETVKLHTSVRGGTDVQFNLSGKRPGPIEVKGRNFSLDNHVIKLGEFQATEGAKAKLQMYVRSLEGELTAEQVNPADSRVQVRVAPTGRIFGKSKVYDVEIEVPPGPPIVHRDKAAEPIVLKLNHPSVEEFKLYADYLAK